MKELEGGNNEAVQELHGDLARKYQTHRTKIEEIWRSFDAAQRAKAFKAGAVQGVVLKTPRDLSLGDVWKFIPEMNLRDIAESGSDYLLNLLKYRATKPLLDQYSEGIDGGAGDHGFILQSMHENNLRHAQQFRHSFTLFLDDDTYGKSYAAAGAKKYAEVMAGLSSAVEGGICVPQSTGELILQRQLYTLQSLNVLVEDILESSTTRITTKRSKKSEQAARAALSQLTIVPKPEKLSLQDLIASSIDQKSSLDEILNLYRTEPAALAYVVNIWFFSRPELLQDEKGRALPLHTDKYISTAFFEAIQNAVIGPANWDYLSRLLQSLDDNNSVDRVRRNTILQEVSNVCHLEYDRMRTLFKRHVQTSSGSKYFKRVQGVYDSGIPRVAMKIKPEALTRDNPRLHYMLRLCQAETDAAKAVDWIKKLDDLFQAHPSERDEMEEREYDCFGDLAVIAGFIQSLSASLQLPSAKRKNAQNYVLRSKDLAAELNTLKTQVDLSAFAIPIDNLLEPGMADGALTALDRFIVEKTGTKMGFLYQDLINSCISEVSKTPDVHNGKIDQKVKAAVPPSLAEAPAPEVRIEQRRQKDKTRPTHSSVYDIVPPKTPTKAAIPEPSKVLKVKQATFGVFSTLFSKAQSRGSVTWAAFEAAMADLKFSVIPKTGSVFTFLPPKHLELEKSLTLHRPHQSRIEGHKLLIYATRLQRVYGWGEQSFEAA